MLYNISMELLSSKLFIIRNFSQDDVNYIDSFINKDNENVYSEFKEIIANSLNDDFDEEGEKHFAIDKDGELIGQVTLTFEKPLIYFSFALNSQYETRIYIQELFVLLIKYLHLLYPHRQIITNANKFNLVTRAVIENFGFERQSIDKTTDTYTYTLFTPNPNKGK